jgi:hypothetical protein
MLFKDREMTLMCLKGHRVHKVHDAVLMYTWAYICMLVQGNAFHELCR